ncbi:MAG TPA: TonB-dependent receptor [Gemmatimonadales bacterium]|nr:TonB-dependent receptor [Gemmatimonadales bacterium]
MRSLARPGLALLVALLALCSPLDAQRLGSIIGTVRSGESGPGLEGARVLLIGTELVVITNSKGEFAFHGITPGKYVIQASAIGFATLTSPIDVKPLETVEVRFEADAESFRLPDLEVAERPNLPADFVRRSQEGRGRYFSRAEIEKRSPQTVADLLRTVPGMRVDCRGIVCRAVLSRAPRGCQPTYWMDGIPADPTLVWLQPPRDLDGVEVYSGPSSTPPELERGSNCGAIVRWTRTPPPWVKKVKPPKP